MWCKYKEYSCGCYIYYTHLKFVKFAGLFYLDVNGWLNGKFADHLGQFGTCDVYINGKLKAKNVTDYWTPWPGGTKYKIVAKANTGCEYKGVYEGSDDPAEGTINAQVNVVLMFDTKGFETVSAGEYNIINVSTQKYLDVLDGGDYNNCNVRVFAGNGSSAQIWSISGSDPVRYKIKPQCTADRVLNQYGDSVVSGSNVCLWDNTDDDSQRWGFERVLNGYIIHCAGNQSCVLDVDENGNVCVANYVYGNPSQIWRLELASVHQADLARGDLTGDGVVTDDDAIYLLFHTFFPEEYPISQNVDFNHDRVVSDDDAIYLLFYTFFPEDYPLG